MSKTSDWARLTRDERKAVLNREREHRPFVDLTLEARNLIVAIEVFRKKLRDADKEHDLSVGASALLDLAYSHCGCARTELSLAIMNLTPESSPIAPKEQPVTARAEA